MDIVLGLGADDGSAPGHAGDSGHGSIGAPVVGRNGLLDILETARGLGYPPTTEVLRVGARQAVLEGLDGPPRFWSRSLQVD
uniref:hypothetical protein n=1 Tax=Blastomonas sp. TaxID=1909299 RepID=UPI0035934005